MFEKLERFCKVQESKGDICQLSYIDFQYGDNIDDDVWRELQQKTRGIKIKKSLGIKLNDTEKELALLSSGVSINRKPSVITSTPTGHSPSFPSSGFPAGANVGMISPTVRSVKIKLFRSIEYDILDEETIKNIEYKIETDIIKRLIDCSECDVTELDRNNFTPQTTQVLINSELINMDIRKLISRCLSLSSKIAMESRVGPANDILMHRREYEFLKSTGNYIEHESISNMTIHIDETEQLNTGDMVVFRKDTDSYKGKGVMFIYFIDEVNKIIKYMVYSGVLLSQNKSYIKKLKLLNF